MLIFFKTILSKNLKIFFQRKYQHFFFLIYIVDFVDSFVDFLDFSDKVYVIFSSDLPLDLFNPFNNTRDTENGYTEGKE